MKLFIFRNPDVMPDLEIRDRQHEEPDGSARLVATVYNELEGDPSEPTTLSIAKVVKYVLNKVFPFSR